jgi:hypothetical protein
MIVERCLDRSIVKLPPQAAGKPMESTKGRKIMGILRKRFPIWNEILSVFGVVVFTVHSWSLREFLFRLPSFILKYSVSEISAVFFYHITFAFLESVIFCGTLVLISGILPSGWLRSGFVYKGFLFVLVAAAAAIILQRNFNDGVLTIDISMKYLFYLGVGGGAVLLIGLFVLAQKMTRLQKLIVSVADRVSIMLYLYIPLDFIGLLVIGYRLLR